MRHSTRRITCSVLCTAAFAGACEKREITSYTVPKEPEPAPALTVSTPSISAAWTLPESWTDTGESQPGRVTTILAGPDEQPVTVSTFPGDTGGVSANIDRWRGQIGLEPQASADEPESLNVETTEHGRVTLVDMTGDQRLLGAIIDIGDGMTWFVKAVGPAENLETITPAFDDFAMSFRPAESARTPKSLGPDIRTRLLNWTPPASWTPDPEAHEMISAAYDAESGARITITVLAGDGGGALANVNRWRAQLGLEPEENAADVPVMDLGSGAFLTQLASPDAEQGMAVAVVPENNPGGAETWFFKLTGTPESLDTELQAFSELVRSVGLGAPR